MKRLLLLVLLTMPIVSIAQQQFAVHGGINISKLMTHSNPLRISSPGLAPYISLEVNSNKRKWRKGISIELGEVRSEITRLPTPIWPFNYQTGSDVEYFSYAGASAFLHRYWKLGSFDIYTGPLLGIYVYSKNEEPTFGGQYGLRVGGGKRLSRNLWLDARVAFRHSIIVWGQEGVNWSDTRDTHVTDMLTLQTLLGLRVDLP